MQKLIQKYAHKLVEQGLCNQGEPLVSGLDAEVFWNKDDNICVELNKIFQHMSINSLIYAQPCEPYRSIIKYLSKDVSKIYPQDCETRTFLHDIPVVPGFHINDIIPALKARKAVIVPDYGIITFGIVSPEQAFVTYSSVCFSCFVKFFTDYYYDKKHDRVTQEQQNIFDNTVSCYKNFMQNFHGVSILKNEECKTSDDVIHAMAEAGKLVVDCRFVDSFFGNISFRLGNTIYISQTGSSLDELLGAIDACPLDDSMCTGITASSELTAHKDIYMITNTKVILHGHPKFSVIMSMICDDEECVNRGACHVKCIKQRFINDIPIVPGEVGTGHYGLCKTLPPAVKGKRGAIVYGHGLFTISEDMNFIQTFNNLRDIEHMCVEEFEKKIRC